MRNSNPTLNVHKATQPPIANISNGVAGPRGFKGAAGESSQLFKIAFVSTAKSPALLKGPIIPTGWDDSGFPKLDIRIAAGDVVLHAPTSRIWTYANGPSKTGWVDVGSVTGNVVNVSGAKGEIGNKGEVGAAGVDGQAGCEGLRGRAGEKGANGEAGLAGAAGARGEQGFKGERGANGLRGSDGSNGVDGADGKNGLNGAKGEKGSGGSIGLTGIQGQKGSQGSPAVFAANQIFPSAAVSFNGITGELGYRFNIDRVDPVGVGRYRVRLLNKIDPAKSIIQACSVDSKENVWISDITARVFIVNTVEKASFNAIIYST